MHDQLPKIFCFIKDYNENYIKRLNKNIAIIYRNYNKNLNKLEIKKIKKICEKSSRKFYLANNIKVALELDLDGVYIPSFNKQINVNCYSRKKKFKILGSAHNIPEIRITLLIEEVLVINITILVLLIYDTFYIFLNKTFKNSISQTDF